MTRRFDLILFGATGYTGRLVAEHLARFAPAELRIALAGRSLDKLAAVARGLPAPAERWPHLLAEASNAEQLAALAHHTRVICTTVGPYGLHGLPLVAACARAGTHYTDLTGEVPFMREAIDRFHEVAQQSGARVVHACGFDSIPSDLGVLLLHDRLGALARVTYVVEVLRGGFSGGTVASMLNLFDQLHGGGPARRLMADPYALVPEPSSERRPRGEPNDLAVFGWDEFTSTWLAPFFMAPVNARVVRRSNALLGHAYGRGLRYREALGMRRRGLAGAAAASGLTAGMTALGAVLSFKPTRRLLARALPRPGEGPSEQTRTRGRLRVTIHGEAEDGRRAHVRIEGQGDPGYQLTALMLAEATLCLVLDEARLPPRAGDLTPATGMGLALVDRLRSAGMTWVVAS